MNKASQPQIPVENISHGTDRRSNIPTSELQGLLSADQQNPVKVAYERRNADLDPQLVWRGKYADDTLTVKAPPLYIQEKIHPKALIEDLRRSRGVGEGVAEDAAPYRCNLFADFNGLPEHADRTDFYQHEQNWTNRMILGDSLQVMASLAEREGLRGQVQAIYLDPPYGIKFNSNFQWSTTSRDVKDGKLESFTREPEQVKAFRDTWRDGIHSYLSYLRDRFIVARDLLTESGSIFVQIGDENVHRVRMILEEIFGEKNFVSQISFATTTGFSGLYLSSIFNHILWFAKDIGQLKYRQLFQIKTPGSPGASLYKDISTFKSLKDSMIPPGHLATSDQLTSQGAPAENIIFTSRNKEWKLPKGLHWKTTAEGLERLEKASRIIYNAGFVRYLRMMEDFPVAPITNLWSDTSTGGFNADKIYVVQTNTKVTERCLLMATDPGDLVLDPTCGSGTTAYVAEQWGRRWITIDTSRVALALARARIMAARYPYYLMADSAEGAAREAALSEQPQRQGPFGNNIKMGFVYERVPHITLKAIANNSKIDAIWERWQTKLESLRTDLNAALGSAYEEWQVPRESDAAWSEAALELHKQYWQGKLARQQEIDQSIAAAAEYEFLYDKPYQDKKKVRVSGPFTVESISPHRVVTSCGDDVTLPRQGQATESKDFAVMILENLRTAGVQRAHKADKLEFTSVNPWPGDYVCAEGLLEDGEKRAGIFIGPEFGTVSRADLVIAAREAKDCDFDLLLACGFNFEAAATDLTKLGPVPIMKVRMNADLHMAEALKNTGKGNLFVIFGEPDISILPEIKKGQDTGRITVRINGVDVYYPNSGEIRSDNARDIACWFVDTDYNGESFFVRQAYFLGQNDPYQNLKNTLKAEINEEVWQSLRREVSRPFAKPKSGHIAVKVINHLGDEVMKVFRV